MDQTVVQVLPESMRKNTFVQIETKGKHTGSCSTPIIRVALNGFSLLAGKTIADLRPLRNKGYEFSQKLNASVCVDVNSDKFFQIFTDRVLAVKSLTPKV